jgi:hypothetical protein
MLVIRSALAAFLALGLAVALAGCGDDDNGGAGGNGFDAGFDAGGAGVDGGGSGGTGGTGGTGATGGTGGASDDSGAQQAGLGFGEVCTKADQCSGGVCHKFGQEPDMLCTQSCTSNDTCPTGSQGKKCNQQGVCRP